MRPGDLARVGLTVVVASVLLIGATFAMRGALGGGGSYLHRVSFDEVQGIQTGAPVRARGVEVGVVERIELRGDLRPELTLRIASSFRIQRQDRIRIVGGLFSFNPPYVEITPGARGNVPGPVVGEAPVGPDQLLAESNELLRNLNRLATNLNRVTEGLADAAGDRRLRDSLLKVAGNVETVTASGVKIARNMESATARSDRLIASFQKSAGTLEQALRRADRLLAEFQGAATETRGLVGDTRAVVRDAGKLVNTTDIVVRETGTLVVGARNLLLENRGRLNSILENLDSSLKQLDGTLTEARGFLGDPQLRTDLKETAANIRAATEGLKQIATDVRTITGDEKVQEDLRSTLTNLREATTEAGDLVKKVREVVGGSGKTARTLGQRLSATELDVTLMRAARAARTRLDFDATIPWSRDTSYRLGVYDFGEGNKFNIQSSQRVGGGTWLRYGVHASTLGLGVDVGGIRRPLSLDLYGVDDPRLDVRGAIPLRPYLDLTLGFDNLFRRADPVIGVRYRKH